MEESSIWNWNIQIVFKKISFIWVNVRKRYVLYFELRLSRIVLRKCLHKCVISIWKKQFGKSVKRIKAVFSISPDARELRWKLDRALGQWLSSRLRTQGSSGSNISWRKRKKHLITLIMLKLKSFTKIFILPKKM
jgi:hypothetical protein